MKKLLLMLGILSTVTIAAKAQTETGNSADKGEQIRVVTGVKKNTNTATTTTTKHTYHSTAHHTTMHHKYAHTTHRKPVHHAKNMGVAVHHTTHKAHRSTSVKANNAKAYTANKPMNNMNTVSAQPPMPVHKPTVQENRDMKVPKDYPGASNGGWDNGTNGKAGTNSQDGELTPNNK